MLSKSFQTDKTEAPAGRETLEGLEHTTTRVIIPESHQSCSQTAASCTNPVVLAPKRLEDLPSDLKAREGNTEDVHARCTYHSRLQGSGLSTDDVTGTFLVFQISSSHAHRRRRSDLFFL